jgi:hypothetical protein
LIGADKRRITRRSETDGADPGTMGSALSFLEERRKGNEKETEERQRS